MQRFLLRLNKNTYLVNILFPDDIKKREEEFYELLNVVLVQST